MAAIISVGGMPVATSNAPVCSLNNVTFSAVSSSRLLADSSLEFLHFELVEYFINQAQQQAQQEG
jgi:hypothetical protein